LTAEIFSHRVVVLSILIYLIRQGITLTKNH